MLQKSGSIRIATRDRVPLKVGPRLTSICAVLRGALQVLPEERDADGFVAVGRLGGCLVIDTARHSLHTIRRPEIDGRDGGGIGVGLSVHLVVGALVPGRARGAESKQLYHEEGGGGASHGEYVRVIGVACKCVI